MEKVTAQTFFQSWLKAVEDKKETLKEIWRRPKEFTSTIRGWEDSVVSLVAKRIELQFYPQDYYSIDTVFYNKEKDLALGSPTDSYWFRTIRVAFEHENVFNSKLYEEISHLLITTCELRVLVIYPPESFKDMLEFTKFFELINETPQSKALSEEQSFLLICDYEAGYTWEGFTYDENQKWKSIKV